MKKGEIIALIVVIGIAVFLVISNLNLTGMVTSDKNILMNGDFNEGQYGSAPSYWKKTKAVWATLNEDEFSSAPYSMRVIYNFEKGGIDGYVRSYEFDLKENTKYKASYMVKGAKGEEVSGILIQCGDKIVNSAEKEQVATSWWKKVEVEFDTSNWEKVKECYVYLEFKDAVKDDMIYLDNVKIEKI